MWNEAVALQPRRFATPRSSSKGSFLQTGATIEWSAEENGFQFESEAPNPSRNLVSVLGQEQNGAFFT
jgi:hypothetical protein